MRVAVEELGHSASPSQIRACGCPAPGCFGLTAHQSLNKALVLELARCEWIEKRGNVIALERSGTGKTHTALALGLAARQRGQTRERAASVLSGTPRRVCSRSSHQPSAPAADAFLRPRA